MSLAEGFHIGQKIAHEVLFRLDQSNRQGSFYPAYTGRDDFRHIAAMAEGVDIETIRTNIRRLMVEKDIKPTTLSQKVGKSKTLVKDLLEKTNDVSFSTLVKLAAVLGVDPGSIMDPGMATPLGPRLYVKGQVAAGVWKAAIELPETDWQTFTGRADIAADMDHRFGLRVVGDSMDLVYPHGSILECVSVFGRVKIEPGKRVVVIRTNVAGDCEATVKELVEMSGSLWAVPRSSNPAHAPIKLDDPEEGIVETRIAAVVVASVRPE